jgi:hypothetical protein
MGRRYSHPIGPQHAAAVPAPLRPLSQVHRQRRHDIRPLLEWPSIGAHWTTRRLSYQGPWSEQPTARMSWRDPCRARVSTHHATLLECPQPEGILLKPASRHCNFTRCCSGRISRLRATHPSLCVSDGHELEFRRDGAQVRAQYARAARMLLRGDRSRRAKEATAAFRYCDPAIVPSRGRRLRRASAECQPKSANTIPSGKRLPPVKKMTSNDANVFNITVTCYS